MVDNRPLPEYYCTQEGERDMKNSFLTIKDMTIIAIFTAVIVVCSWISIPMVIPFTLQTLAVFTAAGLLGTKRGTLTVLLYILLAAVGLPVLTGFRGGFGALLGPTGGYVLGFLLTALELGLITKKFGRSVPVLALAMVLGAVIYYSFGTAWFIQVYTPADGSPVTLMAALSMCVFPFLIPDAAKIAVAILLVKRLEKTAGRFIENEQHGRQNTGAA